MKNWFKKPILSFGKLLLIVIISIILFSLYMTYGLPYPANHDSLFPNVYFERAIRKEINKPKGKITPEDCLGITELDLSLCDYNTNLEGLQYFVDLEVLSQNAGRLKDISALAELTKLRRLDINLNEIEDLTPLTNLSNLEWLGLRDNRIQDISPLLGLENCTIDLAKNPVKNIELLKDKPDLQIYN